MEGGERRDTFNTLSALRTRAVAAANLKAVLVIGGDDLSGLGFE